jgi:succinyl-diaminopimelate desuccinylase
MTVTDARSDQSENIKRRLVELTRDLILIPSTSTRPDEIERCMEFVINHVEQPGEVTVHRYCENDVLSAVLLPKGVRKPQVMLFAHLDVISLPGESVYRSSVRDGKVFGPGAGDMKGALAVLLEIFRVFHERHPGASLGLVVTSDEERGGNSGTRFLVEKVGLRCGTAIVPDSGSLNEIAVEEKGILHLKLHFSGASGHACRPWLVDNPMERMVDALSAVRSHFDTLRTEDQYWYPTCTVTVIRTANEVPNRIPHSAEAVCDIRFPPPYTAKQMLSKMRKFLGDGMELEVILSAEPSHLSPDPLFVRVTEEVTGTPARLIREHGGSDARFLCPYGIPIIMSRPLIGNLHAEDEWVDINSMETFYRIYERYLEMKLNLS